VAGVLLTPALAAPAVAETAAQGTLAAGLERCGAPPDHGHGRDAAGANAGRCLGVRRVDFDLEGMHLYGLRGHFDDGRVRAAAEHVTVALLDGELSIAAAGVSASIDREDVADDDAPAPDEPGAPPAATAPTTWKRRLETELRKFPTSISIDGTIDLSLGEYAVRVADPDVRRDPDGSLTGHLDVALRRNETTLATGRALELHTAEGATGRVDVHGVLSLLGGDEVGVRGHVDGPQLRVQVATHAGGQAWAVIPNWRHPARAELRFERLDLGPLDPVRSALGERVRMDLQHTTLSGELSAHRRRTDDDELTTRVSLREFTVDGLVVDSAQLSREPLYLQTLTLDGDVSAGRNRRIEGELRIRHGAAVAAIEGQFGPEQVELDAHLDPMTCQALLGSMPGGLVPMLEGTRLRGNIEGHLGLAFTWADLEAREAAEIRTGEPQPAPGRLEVDFPFLEACVVERDAPGVEIAALAGPYRHRFLSDGGRELTRVFDAVDPQWVRLEDVATLSRAFVTLEDVGFWRHDGFDREQMARAFWHDLSASRFSRGASTISQQTARNLWLGIDRSVGRKLQEAVYASRMEAELSKHRILEIYLNIIELGPEVHGVHEAAMFHFGRPPGELNLLQAVHLASLAPGPVMYSERFASGEVDQAWATHLRQQLRRMRIHGLISREQEIAAGRSDLRLLDRTRAD